MTKKPVFDQDAPPTRPDDWVGAAKVYAGQSSRKKIRSPMTFSMFRASNEPSLFALTDANETENLPPCPNKGTWIPFKEFKETGQARIGFSETEAKSGIKNHGYYLARVRVALTESVA